MAIPVKFQQFKSAGVYRLVYDKSTVLGQEAALLRLVVGYSPKGPFNTPVYITNIQEFKAMYGDISKTLEKRGCYFHRTAIQCLSAGPILCLNLKPFEDEQVGNFGISDKIIQDKRKVTEIFNTAKFWRLDPDNLNDGRHYIHISAIDSMETSNTVFIRKAPADTVKEYNITVSDWYKDYNEDIPEFLVGKEEMLMSEFFTEIFVFKGKFLPTNYDNGPLSKYFTTTNVEDFNGDFNDDFATGKVLTVKNTITDAFGDEIDALTALYNESAAGPIGHYIGSLIPNFIDKNYGYRAIDILVNSDSDNNHLMMSMDDDMLYNTEDACDTILVNSVALKSYTGEGSDNEISPIYIEGFEFAKSKPTGSSIPEKLKWQTDILSTITKFKGITTALLSPAEINFRYIVDTFDSYYEANEELKSVLSLLAKQKELCFAILNFPSVATLVKQAPKTFTHNGIFNINYVTKNVLLPSEVNGASFCAFYTPLKFSDGYIDTILPSAGLVSNLFIAKYQGRRPYDIVAGPNYSNIQYPQLVGPDYHYSQEELHVIEPYGVNCMIYRPTFGTFINANQTAKQLPKSALSSVNVRELVIYLQEEIGKVLQSYQWEFNNKTTRDAIKAKADIICEQAKRNGGIMSYLNVMDESNNTDDIIDNEFSVLSTSIEPGRGMGKMVHELTIYRSGQLSVLIKEQ